MAANSVSHTGHTQFSVRPKLVLKFVESKKQDGDQLTIRPLVSLEHPTLPKTNLTKQCSNLLKTYAPK